MRYLLQLFVMLGDLMLIGASAFSLYFCYNIFPLNLILLFMIMKNFKTWQEQGGFMAWDPKMVRKFMKNAKDYGL